MKELLLTLALAQGADFATTAVAFKRGCVEASPLMRQMPPATMYAVKGGTVVGFMFTIPRVAKKHPKTAKTIAWAFIGAGAAAATWNMTQLHKCGGR